VDQPAAAGAYKDWNEVAHGGYRRVGAERLDEWRLCRLTADALRRLAAQRPT